MLVKKRLIFFVIFVFFLIPFVFSSSIESEIQKITHYAEEYETGNINYVQLQIYLGSGRQKLNEILGATGMEHGGILKQEQLKSFLGEPTGETRWVWNEKEKREKRIDSDVPTWEKIIFDGNKIQIKLNAYPFIVDEELVYNLNFMANFKKPKEQLDISGKIWEIKGLAEIFNSNPSTENARTLAKESVNAERTFESYFRQSGEKCEDVMSSIFGTENIRESQQMLVNEITFYVGENFEVKGRLEMCDSCEWNWINLNFWMEGRGPGFKPAKETPERISPEEFKERDSEYFKQEFARIIDEMKKGLEQGDYKQFVSYQSRMQALNEAWNRKSNEVWQQVDKMFEEEMKSIREEQKGGFDWKSFDNKRREKERELRKANYEARKQFFLNLFSGYDKKEMSFSQIEYEKRLVEEFIEFGEEICNNNVDDNKNEKVDCLDSLCAGKICGKKEVEVTIGNEIQKETKDLFCIQGMCQLPEEIVEEKAMICGNHICEGNETKENCIEDCAICPEHPPLNCSGRVMFSGQDENGCSLEPICMEETETCITTADCIQPLCGTSECVEGRCEFSELSECREAECVDGDKKIQNCETGEEIITEICTGGLWIQTGAICEITGEINSCEQYCPAQPHILCGGYADISGTYPNCNCGWVCEAEEPITGNECSVKEDCGSVNDVCSNGRCVTIPELVQPPTVEEPEVTPIEEPEVLPEQIPEQLPEEQPQETPTETQQEPAPVTGEMILRFFRTIVGRITGAITGFQTENGTEPIPEVSVSEPPSEQPPEELVCLTDVQQCPDGSYVSRNPSKNCEFDPCPSPSAPEQQPPEEHLQEFEEKPEDVEEEHPPQEKGVFKAGGICRTALQRTEAFIFFDGWGEPFEQVHQYKPEFYTGGEADWCKYELENLIQQRKEFERSFNEEFVKWFFEDYLANSAEDWEQYVSGIFELYWKNVDNIMQTTRIMQCLEKEGMTDYYTPISLVKYDTEFGSLEFWEEVKTAKLPGMDKAIEVISPYMKIWIFPNKKFIQYEMKKAMKEHEFPGPPKEKVKRENEEGLKDEEREMIKQDEGFMRKIRNIVNKYNGNVDVAIQFKDYTADEIVFNLYAQVNENDILKLEPMLPEEVPEKDITIDIDFEKVYDFIYFTEKEMRGAEEQFPPWEDRPFGKGMVKGFVDGIQVWFKVRDIANSARVSPESAKGDAMDLLKTFFKMMGRPEEKGKMPEEEMPEVEEEIWESKEKITGEVIF